MQEPQGDTGINRRGFMKSAGLIGGGALFAAFMKLHAQPIAPHSPSAAVLHPPGSEPQQELYQINAAYFALEFPTMLSGFFTTCNNLGSSHSVIEQTVIDPTGQPVVRKYPGQLKWFDIQAIRGVTTTTDAWDWRRLVELGEPALADGAITLFDSEGATMARWSVFNAWPFQLRANPLEHIDGCSIIEELVLCHECLIRDI